MKRVLCLLIVMFSACYTFGQNERDFSSRFLSLCKNDTSVHCITISPKMMDEILGQNGLNKETEITTEISKIKSMRVLSVAYPNSKSYFKKTEALLANNSERFTKNKAYNSPKSEGGFWIRNDGNVIIELVMLDFNKHSNLFRIVNLTGNMDEKFILSLSKNMKSKKTIK